MAELVVRVPDQPERVVPLGDRPLTVGRAEECDVWIPEKKASRRHLRISPGPEGGWLAEDLGSANGTFLGERRVLRVAVDRGDELRVGDTTLLLRAAAEEAFVGGTLDLQEVHAGAAVPAAAPAGAPPPPPPAPPGRPPLDARALGRALSFVVLALAALAGVEFLLGARAREAAEAGDARREMRSILQRVDLSTAAEFEADVLRFRGAHPESREEADRLDRWLAYVRERERTLRQADLRLNQLVQGLGSLPESEVRDGLLALQREVGAGSDMGLRIALALTQLDRRVVQDATVALEDVARRADALVSAERPAAALRLVAAARATWPLMPNASRDLLVACEQRAVGVANSLADRAAAAAEREPDPDRRRGILARAWRGLEGTPQGERLAEALRFARPGAAPAAPTPSGAPTPAAPTPTPLPTDVLVRAAEAEKLFLTRRWTLARERFAGLAAEVDKGLLHEEWAQRVRDIDRLLALVDDLARAAAAGGAPARRKPSGGTVVVTAASPESVTWRQKDEESTRAWPEVPERDVLPLLSPESPNAEQRLSLGLLAATVGDREGFVRVVAPLLEKGDRPEEANLLVARWLFGRGAPPEGGYRVHRGEILDREGYERRLEAERLEALRAKAEELLARVAKDPAFQRLDRLRELRDELDRRRRHALLAIFDEVHYPYPYDKGSQPYQVVQREIDERVERVREVWNDPAKAVVRRSGTLEKSLDEWDRTIAALRQAGQEVGELEARMAPLAAYATGEPLTIRSYFRDVAERDHLRYNRWVMEVHNPARTAVASEAEREQTRITNEYRMMMGYYAQVTPGDAPYPSLTKDNVAKALDAGSFAFDPVPLRALRIDDRLVRAARLHSEDMARRGFFSHFAPPNPATGEGQTAPWDRMRRQGYEGGAASENIAQAGDPMTAHVMWCHSSGHHRNILSGWEDQGAGFAGRSWTQNYGNGGGEPTVVPPGAEVPAPGGQDPRER